VALADRLQTSLALLLLDERQLAREAALTLLALARVSVHERTGRDTDTLLAAIDVLGEEADDLRIEGLLARGDIALLVGKTANAVHWFDEALAQARRRRHRAGEPRALLRLAECALHQNDGQAAREFVDEALALFRATRTLRSMDGYEALILQSRLLIQAGKVGTALRLLNKLTDIATRHDLPQIRGRAQQWAGLAYARSRQPDQALEALREARDAFATIGENAEFAQALVLLGKHCRDVGKLDEAQSSFEHALRIQERAHAGGQQAVTLNEFARLQLRRDQLAAAQTTAKKAYTLASSDAVSRARILLTMAEISRRQRRWKQAAGHLREAIELFKKAKRPDEVADAAQVLGLLLRENGQHEEAAEYLAIALSAERGKPMRRE